MKRRNFLYLLSTALFIRPAFARRDTMQLHKSDSRGVANHGWLNSHHTFSFANYYNPERMGFGALRVINDDIVDPSQGFGTHPHNNMEIISVPLRGSLKHKDTMGNETVIQHGEVQAMTAGTGILHSEYNNSEKDDVNFLQIWVLPKKKDIEPNYSQKKFDPADRKNKLQLVVSPDGRENSVEINQDAYFHIVDLEAGKSIDYELQQEGNGLYVFVIEGEAKVGEAILSKRDGLEIEEFSKLNIKSESGTELLLMEVPMHV